MQLVLANGTSVEAASEGPHSDLFWASCGGGGGTFGVATEFTLKLTELPNNSSAVTVIEVNTQWSGLPRLALWLLLLVGSAPAAPGGEGDDGLHAGQEAGRPCMQQMECLTIMPVSRDACGLT